MSAYFRMTRRDPDPPIVPISAGFSVVPYAPVFHHDLIPHLYAASFGEPPWPADWEQIPEFDPHGVFLSYSDEIKEFVGFVVSFQRADFGYISVVAVLPSWRRRGIASALIASASRYLLSRQVEFLQIDVETSNHSARLAYKKLGFNIINIAYPA